MDLSPEMIYEEKPEGQESEVEHSSKGCTEDDEKESLAASKRSVYFNKIA
jgi:hypothetical protein